MSHKEMVFAAFLGLLIQLVSIVCLALVFITSVFAAPLDVDKKVFDINLQKVAVKDAIQLFYGEILNVPYVIEPAVLLDAREVSFKFSLGKNPHENIEKFLESVGVTVKNTGGIRYVTIKTQDQIRSENTSEFVYFPKHRDVTFLTEILRAIFVKGSFTNTRSVQSQSQTNVKSDVPAPANTAAALIDRPADVLMFSGSDSEIAQLKKLLPQIDLPVGQVLVRGYVYEVSNTEKEGSAFTLALNILGGHLSVVSGVASALDSFVQFKNRSIDAVFSALSSDSRFKVLSSPSLRVKSGANGRFSVGQDVPVLGAVSYPGNGGAPVQSVEYRSSGVIFDLRPVIHESSIDLNVQQQISTFVTTDTGVNNSPTLIKRDLTTSLSMSDGDLVVLGGLTENKDSNGKSGLSFLPALFHSKTNQSSKTEILLILQVSKI